VLADAWFKKKKMKFSQGNFFTMGGGESMGGSSKRLSYSLRGERKGKNKGEGAWCSIGPMRMD